MLIAGAVQGSHLSVPIELANFSYRPNTSCLVETEGSVERERLSLLSCTSDDTDLQGWFLTTVSGLSEEFSAAAGKPGELDRAVDHLVTLFLAIGRPATRSVEGLWGEILVIALARNPELLLTAWHSDPLEKYDFVAALGRVEVKTTIGFRREHHFSLEQLTPPDSAHLAIMSILAQPTPSGTSVSDLVDIVERRTTGASGLKSKLHFMVADTLGCDWRRAASQRFSIAEARSSMLMVDGRSVPTVSPDLPPEVSDVRFLVEFAGLPPLTAEEIAAVPLWEAAIPSDDWLRGASK
jgi:hypothetical protein